MEKSLPFNLDKLQLASPCNVSWDEMKGDDRTRFCSHCSKHVYNLSGMTRGEAETLVREQGDALCVRFLRQDGTILTQDCPVGLWNLRRGAALLWTLALAMCGFIAAETPGGLGAWFPNSSNTTFHGIGGGISCANT